MRRRPCCLSLLSCLHATSFVLPLCWQCVSATLFSLLLICCLLRSQGKAEPWEKAQDLTRQAMESARTAQIKACDATKTYENYTRANEAAEAAHSRQAQVSVHGAASN